MMQLSSKNDDSSLCYDVIITHQNFKIDKFGDFSSDIDFNTKIDIFRDAISLIINQNDPRRPKGSSGGHIVRQPRLWSLIQVSTKLFLMPSYPRKSCKQNTDED